MHDTYLLTYLLTCNRATLQFIIICMLTVLDDHGK